ncbi:MAG: hypothetical protein ACI4TB_08420, partial [Lachnospiraceae bacterium]
IWMAALKNGTGLQALSQYSGDYNMPYVTVLLLLTYLPLEPIVGIKCFSILFDFICAAAGGALANVCTKNHYRHLTFILTYSLIFLSPIAILNSGYWGQCDAVYVAFVLLAVLFMLKEKFPLSMIFWGCAFAFKLQAIFGFPILLLYYWKNRKFSFLQFLLIPVTMEVLCLPAIIGGCSPFVTFSVYFAQMKTYPEMYYYYPNFWTFFQDTPYYVFGRMAVVGTFTLLMLESVLILHKEKSLGTENFLPDFCLIVMTILCFLPCMHDRYGYMLEMAAIVWTVVEKRKWWLAVMTQLISLIVYAPAIVGRYLIDARILAVFYLLTFAALVFCQVKRLFGTGGAMHA